jgi:hypothetical protein
LVVILERATATFVRARAKFSPELASLLNCAKAFESL